MHGVSGSRRPLCRRHRYPARPGRESGNDEPSGDPFPRIHDMFNAKLPQVLTLFFRPGGGENFRAPESRILYGRQTDTARSAVYQYFFTFTESGQVSQGIIRCKKGCRYGGSFFKAPLRRFTGYGYGTDYNMTTEACRRKSDHFIAWFIFADTGADSQDDS